MFSSAMLAAEDPMDAESDRNLVSLERNEKYFYDHKFFISFF